MARKIKSIQIEFGGDPGDFSVLHEYKQEGGEYEPSRRIPQEVTRGHSNLMKHLHEHVREDHDGEEENCPICDMGQGGEVIDSGEESEEGESQHNYGTRSAKGHYEDAEDVDTVGCRESPGGEDAINVVKNKSETEYGLSSSGANLVDVGDKTSRATSHHDKENLMKHGEHSKAHPGFRAVQKSIAAKSGLPMKAAGAILANRTRHASAAAKKSNPRLKRVPG